jgi:hypothetical protein
MSGGLTIRMKLELAQFAQRHRIAPATPCTLPLAAPSSQPLIIISGVASSATVDNECYREAVRGRRSASALICVSEVASGELRVARSALLSRYVTRRIHLPACTLHHMRRRNSLRSALQ